MCYFFHSVFSLDKLAMFKLINGFPYSFCYDWVSENQRMYNKLEL